MRVEAKKSGGLYTYKDSGNQQLTLAIKVRERSKQGNWQLISKVVAGCTDRQTGKLSRKKEREIQNSKVFLQITVSRRHIYKFLYIRNVKGYIVILYSTMHSSSCTLAAAAV